MVELCDEAVLAEEFEVEPPTHGFSVRKKSTLSSCDSSSYENDATLMDANVDKTLKRHPELTQIFEAWEVFLSILNRLSCR